MARSLKIAAWIAVLLVLAAGSAPFWALGLIDWNSQRGRLEGLLSQAAGVGIAITGDLEIQSLLPRARLSIGGIEATTGVQDETATISVARVDVVLEVWPLLHGVLNVTRLNVNGLRVAYTIDELGRRQWFERHAETRDETAEAAPRDAGEPFIWDVRLTEVVISHGAFLFSNELTQQTLDAREVNLRATLASLAEPLELSGEFDLNARPVVLDATLDSPGRLMDGEGARLAATIDAVLLQANLDLETWLAPHPRANGSVEVHAPSVGRLAAWLDRPLGQMEDPGELRLSGRVSSTDTRTTLHALALSSPNWDLTVNGEVAFDETPIRLALNIEGGRIDLDRYLPAPVNEPRRVRFELRGKDREDGGLDDPIDLAVLEDFEGEVRIALEGLKVRNFEIGRTAFRAKMEDRVVAVELGELGLYGGRLVGLMNLDASAPDPALDAKLAIDRIDLDSFSESRAKDSVIGGEINGAINVVSRGQTPRALIKALNGTVLLEVVQRRETEPVRPVISRANVQLIIPENEENPYLLGRAVYNDEGVILDIETSPLSEIVKDRGFALDALFESGLANLTYQGDVYRSPIVSFDGNLIADVPSAGRLARWLGADLPQDPGPVRLKASFESDGTQGRIAEAYIAGQDLEAEVSGNFDFSGAVWRFNLKAETGVLRLDRYLPEPAEQPSEAAADRPAASKTVLLLEDVSKDPLNLTAFRKLVGHIEIASQGLVLPGTVVRGVALGLHTEKGLARLDIDKLEVNESVLSGSARVDARQDAVTVDLSLDGTKVDLDNLLDIETGERGPSLGKGDITVTAKTAGDSVNALLRNLAPSVDLNLAFIAFDESRGLEGVTLAARADGLEDPFRLSGSGAFRAADGSAHAFAVDVTSDPIAELLANQTFAVQGKGGLGNIQLDLKAGTETPVTGAKLALELHGSGDSLTDFGPLLDTKMPAVGPFELSARLASEGKKTELSHLDLTLGRSKASGTLSLDTAGERPSIAGKFSFANLDATEFYGDHDLADIVQDESAPTEPGSQDWIFSDDPLPFELLSEADFTNIQVEIAKLKVGPDIILSDIRSTLTLKDTMLHLSNLRGRIYNGDVTGEFKAHQQTAVLPTVELALKGENLDYGAFLHAFDITERLRGRMDFELELAGVGPSLRTLAASLDGRIDLNAKEGEFDREMLGLLAFGTGSILRPLFGRNSKGNLDCIVTTFNFEDGLGDTLVQYIETSYFAMIGDGEIDLKTERLDFLYHPQARDTSLMRFAVPFRVRGSMQSPNVTVDTSRSLLAAARTAGTIASFLNPLVGLGVVAGRTALSSRKGCEAANQVQTGEVQVTEPEQREGSSSGFDRRERPRR